MGERSWAHSLGAMMTGAIGRKPHFRFFGIPVRVEPFFVLVIVLLGFGIYAETPFLLASWIVIASVSVLVHELGHALAFRAYGASPSIVLHGMGGLTSAQADLSPGKSIVVSLAGPFATLIPFGIPAVVVAGSGAVTTEVGVQLLNQVLFVNVVWALLNLAPLLPLDGGNVMASALDWMLPGRGRRIANVVSVVLAAGIVLWALADGWLFLAVLAGLFGGLNIMELARPAGGGVAMTAAATDAVTSVRQATQALAGGQPFVAEHFAREVLARRGVPPEVRNAATEVIAWTRLGAGDVAGGRAVLASLPSGAAPSLPYQAADALASGAQAQGVSLLAWLLVQRPTEPMLPFALMWSARPDVVGEVVHELILQGPPGRDAASRLAAWLRTTGYHQAADTVDAMLSGYSPTPG
ncbi:MAG: hypothetical protein KDB33_06345 [Acidimicrobiales bacterium]|nr:hypothetical protein [Acidimicrobiales bacterium]